MFSSNTPIVLNPLNEMIARHHYEEGLKYEGECEVFSEESITGMSYHDSFLAVKKHCDDFNRNKKLALDSFRKSAELGYAEAQHKVGFLLQFACSEHSPEFLENYRQAVYWFFQASLQNHPDAQFRLGEMCELGGIKGCELDRDLGLLLINYAATLGHLGAKNKLSQESKTESGPKLEESFVAHTLENGDAKNENARTSSGGVFGTRQVQKEHKIELPSLEPILETSVKALDSHDNPYEILGIPQDADVAEIKSGYSI